MRMGENSKKTLYVILVILLLSICSLTIVYAALSTVLKITGNTEVVASNWDIYLDNVQVKNGSVSASKPVITNKSTLSFDVDLNKPGDYYEFTVDVVNNGSIDAMIDSVVKSPNLTDVQAKYVLYEVSYANGESISTKQTLKKGTSTPVKVRIAYRRDLEASDLPSVTETLNLSVTFIYVQSDNTGNDVLNDGASVVNVVSGTGYNVGDEVCIDTECFYVISSNDDTVTMFSKYNLMVGSKMLKVDGNVKVVNLDSVTGIQDSTARGWIIDFSETNPIIGMNVFSLDSYWSSTTSTYPAYVYNENSVLFKYVENYKNYLISLGVNLIDARLISYDELLSLGCDDTSKNCVQAPSWVYYTSFWMGTAFASDYVGLLNSNGGFSSFNYIDSSSGVRPVIVIPKGSL